MINATTLKRVAQTFFWPAVIAAFVGAVIPASRVGNLVPWDKAGHFIVFYVLTFLGVAAFPKRSHIAIGALLSAFGALIEVVQGTALVHRDADWHDWLADTVAILAVLLPIAMVRWRSTHST